MINLSLVQKALTELHAAGEEMIYYMEDSAALTDEETGREYPEVKRFRKALERTLKYLPPAEKCRCGVELPRVKINGVPFEFCSAKCKAESRGAA